LPSVIDLVYLIYKTVLRKTVMSSTSSAQFLSNIVRAVKSIIL